MNQIHGYRNPITKLYWNEITQKWLKKPVRNSSKGKHKGKAIGKTVGKAKGRAIGKAIGKTKGAIYTEKLTQIKALYSNSWQTYGWLPINLRLSDIEAAAQKHWHYKTVKFELDRALSLSSLLIIKRSKVSDVQKRRVAYADGYANLRSRELKDFVGEHYKRYIQLFKDAGFIKAFSTDWENTNESFCPAAFAKAYKFLPMHLHKEGDCRMYYRVAYQSPRLLIRLFTRKHRRKQQHLRKAFRQRLSEMVYQIATCIDIDNFTAWVLANPQEFSNQEAQNSLIVRANELALGDLHITPFDSYGERFHTSFTNINKILRQFITIAGRPAIELDLKASQFFFFACMTLYPTQCMAVLEQGMKQSRLREVMHMMRHFYDTYADVKEFVDASLCNNIYQTIGNKYNGQYSKGEVKDLCFRALFSRSGQSKETKKVLRQHYPNVVKLCEQINNMAHKEKKTNALAGLFGAAIHSVPQLLQRLESRTLIDMVAMQAAGVAQHAFATVHDSYLIGCTDVPLFNRLISNTFTALGLPVPATSQK